MPVATAWSQAAALQTALEVALIPGSFRRVPKHISAPALAGASL